MTQAVLDDWRTAPIDTKLKSMLGFLEKLTLEPEAIRPEDVGALREAGVSEQAIIDAIYICAMFNTIDRIADSFNFNVPTMESFGKSASILLKSGYAGLPGLR